MLKKFHSLSFFSSMEFDVWYRRLFAYFLVSSTCSRAIFKSKPLGRHENSFCALQFKPSIWGFEYVWVSFLFCVHVWIFQSRISNLRKLWHPSISVCVKMKKHRQRYDISRARDCWTVGVLSQISFFLFRSLDEFQTCIVSSSREEAPEEQGRNVETARDSKR